jgi:exonuclease SbcD
MRLIHTSDWHFGKRFLETDLIPLQAQFCDWIVDLVTQDKIDGVLIAGDLYDRSNPKEDAVDLLDEVLHRISAAGASIVAISGNHDSAERLHFGTRFMSHSGLTISTERRQVTLIAPPTTLVGRDGSEVEILPLPYLDPQRVAMHDGAKRDHESVLRAVIDNQISNLKNGPERTIAMAHAFVVGGTTTESERALSVGGTGAVPVDLFSRFGYTALGHLHRPQELSKGHLAYSGSPMSYSFSEEHKKMVRIIDVTDAGITTSELPIDVGRSVVTIRDSFENILKSAKYEVHKDSFVRVLINDKNFKIGAMEAVRQRFPYVLELQQIAITEQGALRMEQYGDFAKKTEQEVVGSYIDETFDDGISDFEQTFISDAMASVLKGDHE